MSMTIYFSEENSSVDIILSHLDNENSVRLLQKLYTADDAIRQQLMIKAEYFKRWQRRIKRRQQERTVYDPIKARSKEFHEMTVMKKYWCKWRDDSIDSVNKRLADQLYKQHMLKKGLEGFKWAIYRSQHYHDIMKLRTQKITLKGVFLKWKRRAYQRQFNRLATTFTNWFQYTQEQKKVRIFDGGMKQKLLKKCYTTWIKRYCVKLKENRADQFSRQCLLSKCVSVWKLFTNESRIKSHRNDQAVVLYTYNVEKKYFHRMVANYRKIQLARQFHRHHILLKCLCLWKEGSEVSHQEKQHDLRVSDKQWTQTTITTMFYYWRERLLMVKAVRNSQMTTQKHVFTVWKTLWLDLRAKHENIRKELSTMKVSRHFTAWKDHVVRQNYKRDILSQQLVKVMLQIRLKEWKYYTDYKKQLRMKCELYRRNCDSSKQQECFAIWLKQYLRHLSVQKARQHWSNNCLRKIINKWKLKCRKTELKEILIETEPDRNLHLIKVMFNKWKTAKNRKDQEIYEADKIREELKKSKLRRMFDIWKKAMEQLNKLQPLIQSRQNLVLKRCFQSWNQIVQHKLQCLQNYNVIVNLRLHNIFNRWRRQNKVHEIEKDIERNRQRKFSHKCLREWRDIVKRKQSANLFYEQHLQSYLFNYWKSRTKRQIEEKTQAIELEERNLDMKKSYFNLWLESIRREKTLEEDKILQTHQHRSYRQLTTAFYNWKHHLQITLVARVYSKGIERKHLKEVLNEWKNTTQYSIQDSIHQFSIRLGLPVNYTDRLGSEISITEPQSRNDDTYSLDGDDDCTMIDDSPRSISSINTVTSLNRLFAGYPSERSVDIEKLDLDNQSLLSGIESAIIDERESKIQRKRELVSVFINRLRHWPVSLIFDHWKDFIINQRELKEAANQVAEISQMLKLKLAFRRWKCHLKSINIAQAHRDKVVCSTAIKCFGNYHKSRCMKRKMADSADRHHMKTELKKYFPVWIEKAKDKQHKENILRLWSTATPEEIELLPLEHQLSTNLNKRTLYLCFSIWQIKHQFFQKIQHVHKSFILKRVITEWNVWASDNHQRSDKCEKFRRKYIQLNYFKQWRLKLQQKQATEEKYEKAWQSYLAVIFRRWYQWAKGNHQSQVHSKQLTYHCQQNKLQQKFYYWRDLTIKAAQVRQIHNRVVALVALKGWREILQEKKQERKTVLQFQVKCYTNLVQGLFQKWRKKYANRLNHQQEKQKYVEMRALEIGKKWRKKSRRSRASQHYKQLQSRRLCEFFANWRKKYARVLNMEEVLESHIEEKNQELISQMLLHWKNRLLLNHVDQVYQTKLQITVFQEWITWAKAKKERRLRGLALQRALQERTQHVYFKLWLGYTKLNQTVKQHFNVKLQIRSLEAWHVYTQKKKKLDANYFVMTARVRHNILLKTFSFLRNRFDYCQALQETAQKIHEDQNKAIQRHSLLLWHNRLDRIMSARCYGKFLAWRVARQWRNFVCRKQVERQKEAEQEGMAIKHYNKHLCKMVFNVMKMERCINIYKEKRKDRIVKQYARLWKWKVDLLYTARLVDSERMIKEFWRKWRIEYRRKQTVDKVTSFHQKQLLSQVFLSWKSLGNKKRRKSSILLPVSFGNMESPGYGSPNSHGNQQCGDCNSNVNTASVLPEIQSKPPIINGGYKVSNGLTKSNIRKIITRSDRFKSKIPSPSTK
ncbi:hypothetical protein LOTGIDRAFT_231057 [Lottia gigantea]|uniref:Sfi1 spindle body domain-containing protein n=1 Tax=Lottia gigantea TaxID=225164 RepID=V4A675_LOTGI|nr:hypothetical protein LOTGIDRAFT_231057 [Lottia gigantea]ESO99393.1 hypothetical protein LOTGIDRAFT_231057 [Lottia gigantea]